MKLPQTLKITVTQEDIDLSLSRLALGGRLCANCPIAVAFEKIFDTYITVTGQVNVYQDYDGLVLGIYELPSEARELIRAFDSYSYKPTVPIEFTAEKINKKKI